MDLYPFTTDNWRAQPIRVVDGDTAYLFVDVGFNHYACYSFRFLDIDTPELNSKDPEEREKAQEAKELVKDLLDCFETTWQVNLKEWPLRIETEKKPDSFGRWLARIFFTDDGVERSVQAELLKAQLAIPYEK